jgi:Leucine-rich repeat (LRR) protein
LQQLPSSIGQLTTLEELHVYKCRRLEALPDTIIILSRLRWLGMNKCSSISKLPATFGLMTRLMYINIDLAYKKQTDAIAQLNALKEIEVDECND